RCSAPSWADSNAQRDRDATQGHRTCIGQINEPHQCRTLDGSEPKEEGRQKVKKLSSSEQPLVTQTELLRDIFIAGLVIAGASQREIAKVVRVDLNRVNRIAK